jgi:hypothetical protein
MRDDLQPTLCCENQNALTLKSLSELRPGQAL